jgi:hypothetical protein
MQVILLPYRRQKYEKISRGFETWKEAKASMVAESAAAIRRAAQILTSRLLWRQLLSLWVLNEAWFVVRLQVVVEAKTVLSAEQARRSSPGATLAPRTWNWQV